MHIVHYVANPKEKQSLSPNPLDNNRMDEIQKILYYLMQIGKHLKVF